MFEKCSNCGSRVVWGPRDELGVYCSKECQNFRHFPGFCQKCADATTAESAGSTTTLNGIGTRLYGGGLRCPVCSSIVQTKYFCLIFIPIIPLGKYRVRYVSPNRYLSRKLMAKSTSPTFIATNFTNLSTSRPQRSEERPRAAQVETPMYCYKHKTYYNTECDKCRLEQQTLRQESADKVQKARDLRQCPVCEKPSLQWNHFTKVYECFNPRCRLNFTRSELAARIGQQLPPDNDSKQVGNLPK